jgi:hypothetical protein
MAAIAFSSDPEKGWVVAGWVMRQVLDDVISQHPDDSEMAAEFTLAKLTSGISVHSLEPEFATRVTNAIRQTVTGILSGTIRSGIHDQPYGNAMTAEQYLEALRELLQAIPSPEGRKSA